VLTTKNGLLFIDLETCCRRPVEFDLVHTPEEVSEHYPGANQDLLRECRILVLAMITTWRWDRDQQSRIVLGYMQVASADAATGQRGEGTGRCKQRRGGVRWRQRWRPSQRPAWQPVTRSFSTTPTGLSSA
jgi:hypothetical protein